MKKQILSLLVATFATVTMYAQQIAVVSSTGATSIYTTLQDAIEGAKSGSVVYLPGGSFPIADSVRITKKLTIIGIGHKAPSENVDGCTIISGSLQFKDGGDGSAVMGCYLTGDIVFGVDDTHPDNLLVRYCNVNAISTNLCKGVVINQNYVRSYVSLGNSTDGMVTNNLFGSVCNMNGGTIANNIIWKHPNWNENVPRVNNTVIKNNIFHEGVLHYDGSNCQVYGNMLKGSWGEDCVQVGEAWSEVFVNDRGITPYSDYHFKEAYKQYSDKGIYGGTGFSDSALPPVPYIVSKSIPQQTDASGKLRIRVAVKAGE